MTEYGGMNSRALFHCAGIAAIIGGILRIIAAFIPFESENLGLEALYLMTDLSFLFGLFGVFLYQTHRLGLIGLAGFVIFAAGIASIVGPEPVIFGVNTYDISLMVISVGAVVLSLQMLRCDYSRVTAGFWLGSILIGAVGPQLGAEQTSFLIAGVMFGAGFISAGYTLLHQNKKGV